MGALHANTYKAKFKEETGFSYDNSTGTDPQTVTNWSITSSSDAIDPNINQILFTAHDRRSDTLLMHVKNADFISSQPGGTMHSRTINDFFSNELSYNRNDLTFITGGGNRNGQLLGKSNTINCSIDGYHFPNPFAADTRQTSTEEMKLLHWLYKQKSKSGKFGSESISQILSYFGIGSGGVVTVAKRAKNGMKMVKKSKKSARMARKARRASKAAKKAKAAKMANIKNGCTGAVIGGVSAYVGIRGCQYVMDIKEKDKLTNSETFMTVGTCAVGGACAMIAAPAVVTGVSIAVIATAFGASVQWLKTKWFY
eukprot:205499_1